MSKGLSWRQRYMLTDIARNVKLAGEGRRNEPVAWRAIDYGPTSHEDYDTARVQWNIEQATRRSLRSLERRGLVELGRCCFLPVADMIGRQLSPQIYWSHVHPDDYVPGEMRTMTGVVLTKAGWDVVEEEESEG
jgi:hypothetical protein